MCVCVLFSEFFFLCVFLFIFCFFCFFFFFKQKTAYEISACLVGSEMCIRDRSLPYSNVSHARKLWYWQIRQRKPKVQSVSTSGRKPWYLWIHRRTTLPDWWVPHVPDAAWILLYTRYLILRHVHEHSLSLIHISEPTRQAEISYAVFCLKKKKKKTKTTK